MSNSNEFTVLFFALHHPTGVCPQQDVVFDFLTVEEHLDLYAGLKGVPSQERQAMITSVIKEIDLEEKENDIAKNLSGGQKRKLCVGIALIANPKVCNYYNVQTAWGMSARIIFHFPNVL